MEKPSHDLPKTWTNQLLEEPPKGLPLLSAFQSTKKNPINICHSPTVLGLQREIKALEKRLDRLDQVNLDKNQAQICTEHFGKKSDVGDSYNTRYRPGILHKIQAKLTEYGGPFLFLHYARCGRLRNHRPAPRETWINLSISGKQGYPMSSHLAVSVTCRSIKLRGSAPLAPARAEQLYFDHVLERASEYSQHQPHP
jgi:hypothetical protein